MPVSLNLLLYYYYNRPLLPCLQLINPYCFISSWLTLTTLPTANQLLLLLPVAILTPYCLPTAPKVQKEELPEGTK
jgi:glycopeptide antibiotics resistance protein